MSPTRREALKLLGAGAALYTCSPAGASAPTPRPGAADSRWFGLDRVRLGESPFLAAQQLDADYLLKLEPDRLLHNFRVNAGLAPKAPVYGGWESVEPWIEIRCHGHTLGHYLGAVACMYQSTGDERFAQRVDYIVSELAECQAKTGGWLTAFPDGVAPLVDSLAGKPFAGVPWYTTHKVLAGLRDAHLHRGSKQALDVWAKFSDWIVDAAKDVPDDRFQKMLDREHGGMNEVFADLFVVTRDDRYSRQAIRFSHRALLDPLQAQRDTLDGLHANTQIPKVIGFSRLADLQDATADWSGAARFFWRAVALDRAFATGCHGDNEHFFPRAEFAKHLGSAKTMETCCTHNMLRLTRALYGQKPAAYYFDYFERALYNGILASQDPDTGMNTYFQATRPGYMRLYHTPFDSFWCCTGSGLENHARYGESIYAHDGKELTVNLFIPSTLEWRENKLTVTQETRFPDEDVVRLRFTGDRQSVTRLRIRHPAWCDELTVRRNGGRTLRSRKRGDYFVVPGSVLSGDVLEIRVPMTVRVETLPNAPDYAAVMFGPLALAGRLGTQGLTPGSQLIVNERESGHMLNEPIAAPTWPSVFSELAGALTRDPGEPLAFTARGFDDGNNASGTVRFAPWFRLAHERYNLYWRSTVPRV